MLRKTASKLYHYFKRPDPGLAYRNVCYSQCGEDVIIDFVFQNKKIEQPSYIDIGAYHPFRFSNTAKFYEKGCRGINIEPNPDAFSLFRQFRGMDVNLNIGIGESEGELIYYMMNEPTMNSFSEENALELEREQGFKIINKQKVSVEKLATVLEKYSNGRFPDFLSLDVEGLDMEILRQIDFSTNRPKVICAETINYGKGKDNDIIPFLLEKNYEVFADTMINTIFVNKAFLSGV